MLVAPSTCLPKPSRETFTHLKTTFGLSVLWSISFSTVRLHGSAKLKPNWLKRWLKFQLNSNLTSLYRILSRTSSKSVLKLMNPKGWVYMTWKSGILKIISNDPILSVRNICPCLLTKNSAKTSMLPVVEHLRVKLCKWSLWVMQLTDTQSVFRRIDPIQMLWQNSMGTQRTLVLEQSIKKISILIRTKSLAHSIKQLLIKTIQLSLWKSINSGWCSKYIKN